MGSQWGAIPNHQAKLLNQMGLGGGGGGGGALGYISKTQEKQNKQ